MLDHDAAVHDDVDSAGFGPGGSFEIDDAGLNPEVLEAQLEHLVDDSGNVPRKTEDVDDIGLDRQVSECGVRLLTEDRYPASD